MNHLTTQIEIFHKDAKLILLANKLRALDQAPPIPLRRIFSIVRDIGFETLLCETRLWSDNLCNEKTCGPHYASCKKYIKLSRQYYNCEVKKKECYKFVFFKSWFGHKQNIETISDNNIIASCIVHRDTFRRKNTTGWQRSYVTEAIIDIPKEKIKFFTIGKCATEIAICERKFQITGNYFSQQNKLTNCCAHAAIKMAIRGYYPNVTAETINKAGGVNHKNKKGNEGLYPKDFIQVIKAITDQETCYSEARNFESPLDFLKLIYHAIESKFPIILLFTFPKHPKMRKDQRKQDHHAVSLIGHTFNKHSWWAYARKGYFTSNEKELAYLPSLIWCDNFVIQDDNLGPYYLLPVRSLKITDLSTNIPFYFLRKILQDIKYGLSKLSKRCEWMYTPLSCIIAHPKEIPDFNDVLKVEVCANKKLIEHVDYLDDKALKPKENVFFSEYFFPNLKSQLLVLRTFALYSKEYLQYIKKHYQFVDLKGYIKTREHTLPNLIWITEISIPELFWINHMKLGEIITDPKSFHINPMNAVKFVRLPGLLSCFGESGKIEIFYINEDDSRYPLISPKHKECSG